MHVLPRISACSLMTLSKDRPMTDSHFESQLQGLIQVQRAAQIRDGVPGAETRRDRLSRAEIMLMQARDAIVAALSEDFGHRSAEETKFEIFGALNAFRTAAANVEDWMQPTQHTPLAPDAEARVEYVPLGVIGIIGPWNYPIMCVFAP